MPFLFYLLFSVTNENRISNDSYGKSLATFCHNYTLAKCIILSTEWNYFSFLSHLLLQKDIGVQVSVRSYVRPFVRPSVRPSTFNMGIL